MTSYSLHDAAPAAAAATAGICIKGIDGQMRATFCTSDTRLHTAKHKCGAVDTASHVLHGLASPIEHRHTPAKRTLNTRIACFFTSLQMVMHSYIRAAAVAAAAAANAFA
jgi:hypothetical protein